MQRWLRAYRRPFYDRLRPSLADEGVILELLHGTDPEQEEPGAVPAWAERPPTRIWAAGDRQLVWQDVLGRVGGADLVVVEQAVQNLVNYPLLVWQAAGGPRVAFWGHGRTFDADGGGGLVEHVKAASTRRGHWFFAYNDVAVDAASELGFPPDRITNVRNATDTAALERDVAATTDADVTAARAELGLTGGHVCAFLGSVDHVKRLDFLLEAADLARARVPDLELVFVGDGDAVDGLRAATADRPWVRWAGPRTGRDLAAVLRASELLLVPGWAGLVIVDSFAAGVPLVASGAAPHPPEISYLADGVNGRLVMDGGRPSAYADAVVDLLTDDAGRARLAAGARAAAADYRIEAMADRFRDGVLRALAAPRRRS